MTSCGGGLVKMTCSINTLDKILGRLEDAGLFAATHS